MERGFVLWFTGLPGSGKTSIAKLVLDELRSRGFRVELLDGDWVRKTINPDAGFTREERRRHLIRVAWIARLLARNGVVVLCSFISPYKDVRSEIRRIVEEDAPFIEVYAKCSLEECIRRDPKGLYKRALTGEIKNFTGISDPYEEPESPDIILDTEHLSVSECVSKVIEYLKKRDLVERLEDAGFKGPWEKHPRSILKALSYRLYQSFLISPLIVFTLTGNWILGLKFGIFESIIKIPAYYLFERIWAYIGYGYMGRSVWR
ncbi:MAG: adenylyl-sulfate kinase [Thermoplasmata archaeon]|nr:MAG: adenylyl-sulfate kinase [Thermoplasmata archaeon]